MPAWLKVLVFVLCLPPAVIALARANELFFVSVRGGRVLYIRGRISPVLLREFEDVVARAAVARASLRAVLSGGRVRLLVKGTDGDVAQRLRNVIGIVPEHKLRAAQPPRMRNLGQRLGIAWLAWRLDARQR
jgi:hypothetical protein